MLAKQGEAAKAEAEFNQSLQLLAAHGYKPDLARTYVALGQLARERGQETEAGEALETAATCFRDMGFTFEVNQTLSRREPVPGR